MTMFCKGLVLAAGVALGGLSLQAGTASAMPMIDTAPAVVAHAEGIAGVEQTRWVCGPYRCFWRPNFYGPRPFYGYGFRGPGWRGGWRGGYGGWHRGGYYRRGW